MHKTGFSHIFFQMLACPQFLSYGGGMEYHAWMNMTPWKRQVDGMNSLDLRGKTVGQVYFETVGILHSDWLIKLCQFLRQYDNRSEKAI